MLTVCVNCSRNKETPTNSKFQVESIVYITCAALVIESASSRMTILNGGHGFPL